MAAHYFVNRNQSGEAERRLCQLTLSTVGSTRALFFRGGCVGSPPELVPSPAPGAAQAGHLRCNHISGFKTRRLCVSDAYSRLFLSFAARTDEDETKVLIREDTAFSYLQLQRNRTDVLTLLFVLFGFPTKDKKNVLKQNWKDCQRKKTITFHQRWSAYINKWTLATQQPCVLIQRLVYTFNPGLLLQIKTGTLLAIADCVPDGWLEFTPYSILNEELSLASLSHKAWSFFPSI